MKNICFSCCRCWPPAPRAGSGDREKIEYKCGEQIISADFLDDDSMIARVDGINYVLVRVAAADGRRYENTATGMTFMQNGNGTYLTIKGRNYPMCQEIVR